TSSRVALRDPADDQIDSEQHPVNLREVSDERVENIEIAIDRDDAELEELFPDRGAEECLEEHRVPEPDEAVQEPGHVPSQTQECDREHEEQVDGRDDEAIDQGREEPVDPMLQQGRVVADQVKGRRHGSPIRRRRYRTRMGEPCLRPLDRKSTRLNSSHVSISYAVFCLKKKNTHEEHAEHHAHCTSTV